MGVISLSINTGPMETDGFKAAPVKKVVMVVENVLTHVV